MVTLSAPHAGSQVARRTAGNSLGKFLFGKSFEQRLHGYVPLWTGGRDIGVIAGSLGLGIGRMPIPNDVEVSVKET